MYRNEIDRFNKLIDEKHIYQASKKALKEIVEEFFSRDYNGVSKEQMENVKGDFEGRFLKIVISRRMKTEINEIDNIHDQIKTSLNVILDKSVDKSKSETGCVMKKISESVMIQPNIHGVGIDLKKLFK